MNNLSSGIRVVPCERTDRHDEAKSCFSQFCERAPKSEISDIYKFLSKEYDRKWALYILHFASLHDSDLC